MWLERSSTISGIGCASCVRAGCQCQWSTSGAKCKWNDDMELFSKSCETLILQSERVLSLPALLNLIQERKHNIGASFCKTLDLRVLRNQRHRWSTVSVLPGPGNYLTTPGRQHKEEQPASSCGRATGSTDHFGTWSSFPRSPLNFNFRVETLLTQQGQCDVCEHWLFTLLRWTKHPAPEHSWC